MIIKELTTFVEMSNQFVMIQHLYPAMSIEKYQNYLNDMIGKNYTQIAVFEGETCAGMTGLWTATKLWTGKYLEIDNFIVHPDYRKQGIGKMLCEFVASKANDLGCTCIVLDAFTGNFTAHKFYYNQGYEPRGFHFIKAIDKNGFS